MSDVLSYSESPQLAEELASVGNELASALGGSLFSVQVDSVEPPLKVGALTLLVKSDQQIAGDPELVTLALAKAIELKKPSVLLLGTTRLGREVSSRIAVRFRMGSLVEVSHLRIQGDQLVGERGMYAGKFLATVASALPSIALVRQGAYPRSQCKGTHVEEIRLERSEGKVERVGIRSMPKSSIDLKGASVIVSAGRGIRRKEDLELVERLARTVGGVVGCSRPLSSDLGWLGEEHHIGLTGIYVHPELYIAVGISGQLQHVAGIKESKLIVAINKDRQAPIFQVSDYGVVGDLYTIVPTLIDLLQRRGDA